jgi:ACR3 family arsenite transporter
MSKFEKYLALWVALCMAIGVVLSQTVPGIGETIDSWQVRGISIPIGICLFLMMYPALLNLQLSELKKLKDNPKPILMTLFSNWVVAPLVAMLMANLFLQGQEQLIVAVILLGASPCTAMVLVWGKLAEGNQEQNVVNTSLNTITIMFFYVPLVSLLTGIQAGDLGSCFYRATPHPWYCEQAALDPGQGRDVVQERVSAHRGQDLHRRAADDANRALFVERAGADRSL